MTLSLRSGPVQLELVPAPITLAAEFSKVLDVPHSLPLPPGVVVQFLSSSRGNINIIANLKSHSHPPLVQSESQTAKYRPVEREL